MRSDQPHRIQFALGGGAPANLHAWPELIARHWPGRTTPTFEHHALGQLEQAIEAASDPFASRAVRPHVIVVVLGPGEPSASIDRMIASLHNAQLGAILLLKDPEAWSQMQQHGVIPMSWESAPATVAAMAFALAERQSAVDLLAREASLAQRCSGGIRTEMDRLHEELHLAAAVQREFTSAPLPSVPGLDFAVLFRPVNFVSGDIYCVRALPDGSVAFLLADAVGHGVPAALLTMVLTNSMSMSRPGPEGTLVPIGPGQVLASLNRRLCESCLASGRFVTAVYGVIDPVTRRATIAGAGHPHPIRVGPGPAQAVSTEGPLLGVFGDAEFDEASVTLGDDDALILYTDGLEAAFTHEGAKRRQRPDPTGEFAAALAGASTSPQACVERLEALLEAQAGSLHQADDVTALCITPARSAAGAQRRVA